MSAPISTEELVAKIEATVEAADAKGAFQTAVPLPMLVMIARRISALVRLTSSQSEQIEKITKERDEARALVEHLIRGRNKTKETKP